MARFREEVLNVTLARLLERRGFDDANPETVQPGARPDILIELSGLKLVIEGRRESGKASLLRDASERVESGVADVSVAVVYPEGLRDAPNQTELEREIDRGAFDGAVFYLRPTGITSDPFTSASVDQIAELVRSAYRIRIQNDIVQAQVTNVEAAIDRVVHDASKTNLFFASDALVTRLRSALGLPPAPPSTKTPSKPDPDLLRIAIFILFDALVFHEVLSTGNPNITSLRRASASRQQFLEDEWRRILAIDYAPIFSIALEVLSSFPSSPTTDDVLDRLTDASVAVVSSGVLSRHDFMGRVYHKLLLRTTGKFYATYYTSIQAAVLLANLEFRTPGDAWDFSSVDLLDDLRVIDPACGSGTLLSAAYMAMKDRYVVARPEPMELTRLNKALVEDVIHGWDVLDYAAHLTLTTLALHAANTIVSRSNVFTLPAGMSASGKPQLGSLDLLKAQQTLRGLGFADPTQQHGLEGMRKVEDIAPTQFDAVIMNPPFSRSSKPKVKFGYASPFGRKALSRDLNELAKSLGYPGLSVAGLGAFFMLLALHLSKTEGARIGIVIPRSMLSGVSWRKVRERYLRDCVIEYVVSNFDPSMLPGPAPWSWSENTNLGEVLIIARRIKTADPESEGAATKTDAGDVAQGDHKTTYINVWRRPRNEIESLLLAHQAIAARSRGHDLLGGSWAMLGGSASVAAAYDVPQALLQRNWLAPCALSHPDLNAFALALHERQWPSKPLFEAAAVIGPDIAQVKGSFTETQKATTHRILWGQQAARNTLVLPDSQIGYGIAKGKASANLHKAKGAMLLLADRPHLTTEAILATSVGSPVLATAFWEIQLADDQCEACFLLWFNSTYGFLEYVGEVTSSRGDIFKAKKDQIGRLRLPLIDTHSGCQALLKDVASSQLLPFAREFKEAADGRGVRASLDHFWESSLKLPGLTGAFYELLAGDPVIAKGAPATDDDADQEDEEDVADDEILSESDAGPRAKARVRSQTERTPRKADPGTPEVSWVTYKVRLIDIRQPALELMFDGIPQPGASRELPGDLKLTLVDRTRQSPGLFDEQENDEEEVDILISTSYTPLGGLETSLPAVRAFVRWLRDIASPQDGPQAIVAGEGRESVQALALMDDQPLMTFFDPVAEW